MCHTQGASIQELVVSARAGRSSFLKAELERYAQPVLKAEIRTCRLPAVAARNIGSHHPYWVRSSRLAVTLRWHWLHACTVWRLNLRQIRRTVHQELDHCSEFFGAQPLQVVSSASWSHSNNSTRALLTHWGTTQRARRIRCGPQKSRTAAGSRVTSRSVQRRLAGRKANFRRAKTSLPPGRLRRGPI